MTDFVPGLELSRAFYVEVVQKLLDDVPHSAALLGTGSDVLGYDTARSTDHGWGPRLQVFVAPDDVEHTRGVVDAGLPGSFRGWPVRYGWDDVPTSHHVEVATLHAWLLDCMAFDPEEEIELVDWLATPQQLLLEVTRGAVHRDDDGRLAALQEVLAWYPEDVWRWLVACQWRRIDQEEPFVGRAAEVGDELGSRIVAARLVRDLVRLSLLLERRYSPYSKWLGTAFSELAGSTVLGHALLDVLGATAFTEREDALVRAVQVAARLHNSTGITPPLDPAVRTFHTRPYRVLGSSRFVDACLDAVSDPRLRALPLVGAVDQLADSADLLSEPAALVGARALYRTWIG